MDNTYHYPSPQASSDKTVVTPVMGGLEAVPQQDNLPEVVYADHFGKHEVTEKPAAGEPLAQGDGKSTIFGLRRSTFILLILLVAVIIIAAAGGGVGGSIAVRNAYDRGVAAAPQCAPSESAPPSQTESASPTATGDRIPPPPTYGLLALDCPNLTGTTHRIAPEKETFAFRATCGSDYPNVGDIIMIVSYSFDDCMRACASFNEKNAIPDTKCIAVHFSAELKWVATRGGELLAEEQSGHGDGGPKS